MRAPCVAAFIAATSLTAVGAQAADVIRIGVLNDQSGTYSEFGGIGSVEAAKLAVEDFGGQVLGRKIEIVAADHQNKPDIAMAKAREWFDADGVEAIADLTNSAVALGVQALAKERGKITLATGAATTRLTNEDCSPTGFHWMYDTYSLSVGTARAVLQEGGRNWFLLAVDYAFGSQMAADFTKTVTESNGKIVGQVKHPLGANDFASYLLQAQASGATVIGLANGGADTINSVKQAAEFGLTSGGQTLVGAGVSIFDVHALGLDVAKGLISTTAYYWDRDEGSRALAARYEVRMKRKPDMVQAGVYSAVTHYLKAMQAAGTDDGATVAAKMRELPVDDLVTRGARVREDGRVVRDMYLIRVKTPGESTGPWDYYKILRTIPADEATISLSDSKCPLVKK